MKKTPVNLSPFHGKPSTKQHMDKDGKLSFTIRPRELTPLRALVADRLAPTLAVAATLEWIFILNHMPAPPDPFFWMAAALPLAAIPVLKLMTRWLLKKRWKMVMTAEQFRASDWDKSAVFDRQLPHKFSLLRHDKAKLEKEKIEQKLRQGKTRNKTYSELAYYGDAFHISYEYLGQRNDIATIFGQKEAIAVVARLKACDEVMDAQGKMGDGTALSPDDQWDDQPGDIEE